MLDISLAGEAGGVGDQGWNGNRWPATHKVLLGPGQCPKDKMKRLMKYILGRISSGMET